MLNVLLLFDTCDLLDKAGQRLDESVRKDEKEVGRRKGSVSSLQSSNDTNGSHVHLLEYTLVSSCPWRRIDHAGESWRSEHNRTIVWLCALMSRDCGSFTRNNARELPEKHTKDDDDDLTKGRELLRTQRGHKSTLDKNKLLRHKQLISRRCLRP